MSAYGMALASVVHEAQQPCALKYQTGVSINGCSCAWWSSWHL